MARRPSVTTCKGVVRSATRAACLKRNSSFASSSTRRMVLFIGNSSFQLNPKLAALPGLRLHTGAATHAFGSFAHKGQADAGPFVGLVGVDALEHIKNPPLIFRSYADAIVLNP